jgi:hypothetical protein
MFQIPLTVKWVVCKATLRVDTLGQVDGCIVIAVVIGRHSHKVEGQAFVHQHHRSLTDLKNRG